ncbi:MAG: hypothetical protein DUD32_01890 [Lactobacillus sp.]|nr:MAG: hypothetical protein DUD32_01890 [Lactobacillus sp.]
MKKIKNEPLRILGIVLSLIGLTLLARPLIAALLGKTVIFSFFNLFSGFLGLALSISCLIVGLVLVYITVPLDTE